MISALLLAGSSLWLATLTLFPGLQERPLTLAVTLACLVVNCVHSFVVLIRQKRIAFLLNLLQVLLFALAHAQVYQVFGQQHYAVSRVPSLHDWQLFAWSHALYAADLVRVFEGYGWRFNLIEARSSAAGILLVAMHWSVSLFVISLLVRWGIGLWKWILQGKGPRPCDPALRKWRTAQWKAYLKRWQRIGCVAALAAFAATALIGSWRIADWLFWPLDNVLRTVDLGNTMGIFRWRLHAVDRNFWTATVGLLFRLMVCAYVARGVYALQVRWLRARALRPLEDYIQDLADESDKVRVEAAQDLRAIGRAARDAVPALVENVDDDATAVAQESRQALAIIGPCSRRDVRNLITLLSHANLAVRRFAIESLGRMGSSARAALPALVPLLAHRERLLETWAEKALAQIDPSWHTQALAGQAVPVLVKKLDEDDRRLRQRAAETLGRLGALAQASITALVKRLRDPEEYVRMSAEMALDAIDPGWRREVYFLGPRGCGVAEGRVG